MSARPRIPRLTRRSFRRALLATVVAGFVVPFASPAFATQHPTPMPAAPASSGRLQGGVARGLSAPFGSFAPVPGRPDDKPIGVPFQSLSRAGGALIRIDNTDVPFTSDGNHFAIAVIDRGTRHVVENGTVNRGATTELKNIARKYVGRDGYLMVVSSLKGIVGDAGNTAAFKEAVTALGGRDLTAEELNLLKGGAAFSIVGVPGGASGGAYISIDHGVAPSGSVDGYLQINVANNLYGVVTAQYPTYDTTNTSATPGQVAIRFDHQTYRSETLPSGSQGFLVLTFDSSLRLITSATVATNGTGDDRAQQGSLEGALAAAVNSGASARYGSTVVIRSIGHPIPVGEGWSNAAKLVEKLGRKPVGVQQPGRCRTPDRLLVGGDVELRSPRGRVEPRPRRQRPDRG